MSPIISKKSPLGLLVLLLVGCAGTNNQSTRSPVEQARFEGSQHPVRKPLLEELSMQEGALDKGLSGAEKERTIRSILTTVLRLVKHDTETCQGAQNEPGKVKRHHEPKAVLLLDSREKALHLLEKILPMAHESKIFFHLGEALHGFAADSSTVCGFSATQVKEQKLWVAKVLEPLKNWTQSTLADVTAGPLTWNLVHRHICLLTEASKPGEELECWTKLIEKTEGQHKLFATFQLGLSKIRLGQKEEGRKILGDARSMIVNNPMLGGNAEIKRLIDEQLQLPSGE